MENLIQKINNLSIELNSLLPMNKDFQQKLDEKFRLEFSYNSNHIEGNTLTYLETKLLLLKDIAEGENHTFREFEEMKAHDAAYVLIQNWAKEERLITEVEIKQLNKIILVKNYWNDAQTPDGKATRREIQVGEYKQFPNSVRLQNGELFEYASPIDTPIKMNELIQWLNDEIEKNTLHPIELAALLHYKFVCIHPFDDGNGRVSRLLMNYILLKNNLPPVVIKSKDKKNYLLALSKADVGDEQAFVKYIAEQLIWSLETSIKAAKGESIEEPDDIDKEIDIIKKKLFSIEDKSLANFTKENTNGFIEKSIKKLEEKLNISSEKFKEIYSNIYVYNDIYEAGDKIGHILLGQSFEITVAFINPIIKLNTSINYTYKINYKFNASSYKIFYDGIEFEKKYNEQLSDLDIENIISIFLKKHTDFINQKIKESQENKKN